MSPVGELPETLHTLHERLYQAAVNGEAQKISELFKLGAKMSSDEVSVHGRRRSDLVNFLTLLPTELFTTVYDICANRCLSAFVGRGCWFDHHVRAVPFSTLCSPCVYILYYFPPCLVLEAEP